MYFIIVTLGLSIGASHPMSLLMALSLLYIIYRVYIYITYSYHIADPGIAPIDFYQAIIPGCISATYTMRSPSSLTYFYPPFFTYIIYFSIFI